MSADLRPGRDLHLGPRWGADLARGREYDLSACRWANLSSCGKRNLRAAGCHVASRRGGGADEPPLRGSTSSASCRDAGGDTAWPNLLLPPVLGAENATAEAAVQIVTVGNRNRA